MRSQNRSAARHVVAVAVLGAACIVSQSCSSSDDRAQTLNPNVFPSADAGQEAIYDPDDWDHDGYTPATGDCNEYDALVNPGAFEYVGNDVDDDCDGTKDNGYADCDEVAEGIGVSAEDAATAMNLCTEQFLLKADYGFVGVPEQRAVRTEFGPNIAPRLGSTMLVMSSGLTLLPTEPGFVETAPGTDHAMSTARPFAYASRPECPSTNDAKIYDLADLQLKLKAPTNAKAFAFDFRFMTAEYPDYYCSTYNDAFAAVVESERYERENVAYGAEGEFVSVNVSFWAICENTDKYDGCSESPSSVDGTGFGSDSGAPHGATRWLTTSVPVEPGEEFTLHLAVWDEGDNILDSTVLVDNFRWDINPAEKETTQEVK
jgi:Putative metal-binding motif